MTRNSPTNGPWSETGRDDVQYSQMAPTSKGAPEYDHKADGVFEKEDGRESRSIHSPRPYRCT